MGKKKKDNKAVSLWNEFKKFISRGNVVDMAIGVIMGSAFSAIVTAFTNVLLTLCTWPIPGGINGLITILPALNANQMPPEGSGLATTLTVDQWLELTASEQGLYTLHGNTYVYNSCPVLDWGVFINAIISFLVISLVLFTILKIVNYSKKKAAELKEMELELYYQKHPEERPTPETPAPAGPTELDILKEIRDELKSQKENSSENK